MLEDEMIVIGKQIYLPNEKAFKGEVLKETHKSRFVIHPRSSQIYRDLKEFYWWPNLKKQSV
jgi:hypothetical protein